MSSLFSSKQYNLYRDDSQGLPAYDDQPMNKTNLIRIHHADYLDDIPFWISWTEGRKMVLEVGCGHGRVAFPLLAAGREVVGVDFDLPALQSFRDELEAKELELQKRAQIFHEDFMTFQFESSFGTVIIPCNTYSTFTLEERHMIISNVYKLLSPGGVFVASLPNPVQLKSLYDELRVNPEDVGSDLEGSFPHPETGNPVQVSSRLIANEKSLGWDWIYDHLQPDGQVDRYIRSTEHYLTTQDTFRQELIEIGFDRIRFMGDFDNSEYTEDSPYLILSGMKPAN